jgi:GxxExxY protein
MGSIFVFLGVTSYLRGEKKEKRAVNREGREGTRRWGGCMDSELLYKKEVYDIFGAAIEVHRTLGTGFLEAVYQEAFELELKDWGISFESQKPLYLHYKGNLLGKEYVADLVCFGRILVELKAVKEIAPIHRAQVINYLKITGLPVGLLINFCSFPKLERYRIVCSDNLSEEEL